MGSDLRQAASNLTGRPAGARKARLALWALAFALLLGPALGASAMSGAAEAGRLQSVLAQMTDLANRQLRPPALRLARDLPGDASQIDQLRDPASTTQTQVKIALDELRQMTSLTLDPHYMPALVAAGRAYVAVSGQDPLTETTINPDYLGLDRELAGDATQLGGAAADAGKLSSSVKRLTRELISAKQRASRLAGEVRRMRAAGAAIPKR